MKNIIYLTIIFITLSSSKVYATQIYIPPGDSITVPSGSNICTDTVFVDSLACLILGDSSCICPGIKILGPGSVIIAVENNYSEIPKKFELYQNYPNPFNPSTNIRYDLPKNGFVKLVVFDALGRDVVTLVNEQLKPGIYEVDWNATNYPSGVYFYKLTAGDYVETKKMLLVK